jgi:hypothetical protein
MAKITELAAEAPTVPPQTILGKVGRASARVALAIVVWVAVIVGGGVVIGVGVWLFR